MMLMLAAWLLPMASADGPQGELNIDLTTSGTPWGELDLDRECTPLDVTEPELNPGFPARGDGPKTVAVIRFHYNDGEPGIWDDAIMASELEKVSDFYEKLSYGKLTLQGLDPADGTAGDVYGWYKLERDGNLRDVNGDIEAANDLAAADGFDPSDYDMVFYLNGAPCAEDDGTNRCAFAGVYLGTNLMYTNGWTALVGAHEGLHLMGLLHANLFHCTDWSGQVQMSPQCTSIGYGDRYDVQGRGGSLSVWARARLGWLCDDELVTVTQSGSTLHYLDRIDRPSRQRPLGVQIPLPKSSFGWQYVGWSPQSDTVTYVIEYVEGLGVLVRLTSVLNEAFDTFLIDESMLSGGESVARSEQFYDPVNDVTIRTLFTSTQFATVEVCVGPCNLDGPILLDPTDSSSFPYYDRDYDGIGDVSDNCVYHANYDQADLDGDGVGRRVRCLSLRA